MYNEQQTLSLFKPKNLSANKPNKIAHQYKLKEQPIEVYTK
jgi:hypothetical protein